MKDWTGNTNSTYKSLGASNHADHEREKHDFYATDPKALELLLQLETFSDVWECACGQGHLSEVLKKHNIHSRSSDLINRGYGDPNIDFLSIDNIQHNGDIITNPPFRYAKEFVLKSLSIIPEGRKVAMFLRMQFLESSNRKSLFVDYPPTKVYVASSRINCAINGQFQNKGNSAMAFCWFVWVKGYKGEPVLKWFN